MSRADGGRQNRLNFERKNNCDLNFKFGTRSFRADFFGKRHTNKSQGNNDKFIADRHANVGDFFRQRVSSTLLWNKEQWRRVSSNFLKYLVS